MPAVFTLLGEVLVAIFDFLDVGDLSGELILILGDEDKPVLLLTGELIINPSLLILCDGFL